MSEQENETSDGAFPQLASQQTVNLQGSKHCGYCSSSRSLGCSVVLNG